MARKILFIILIGMIFIGSIGFLSRPGNVEAGVSPFPQDQVLHRLDGANVTRKVQALTPMSIELVDQAMAVLSKGWPAMSPAERQAFLLLYDPSNTGEVDERFVELVLENYRRIRRTLNRPLPVKYEPDSRTCRGERIFYTDIVKLHVCPYFLKVGNDRLNARTLIHEYAHIALLVADRPYYDPASADYAALTPYGSQANQLPLVGPLLRELTRGDTLYHPDAYAHFTVAVSGQPGAIELYLDNEV
jgi:hypothetical protein